MRKSTVASGGSGLILLLLLALAAPARAGDAEAETGFVDKGLALLADGRFADAAQVFEAAALVDPEAAAHPLHRGIALIALERGAEAKQPLERAAALAPGDGDVQVWSHVRLVMFEPAAPAGPPPIRAAPYAPKLIVAALAFRSPDRGERARAKATIEEVARELARRPDAIVERVRSLHEAKRHREALVLIEDVGERGPLDPRLVGYRAHCKLALGDARGARGDYTLALRTLSTVPGYLIGRARCEIALGSLRAAEADLALARRVGSRPAAGLLADADGLLAAARKGEASARPTALPDAREEEYTRELCRLTLDAGADPKNAGRLAAVARFHLEPTAVCDVTVRGVATRARVPCGKPELARAEEVLGGAAKLAPGNPEVLTGQALLAVARGRRDDALALAERALAAGAVDLDLAIAHLEGCVAAARRFEADVRDLRTTRYWVETRRVQDRWEEFPQYRFPTPAELARADALEREARGLRARAFRPLEEVAERAKGGAAAEEKAVPHIVLAFRAYWDGDLDGALHAAERALDVHPTSVRALRFLVAACKKGGLADRAARHRQQLDELTGPWLGGIIHHPGDPREERSWRH